MASHTVKLIALRLLAYTIDCSIIGSFVLVTQFLALVGLFNWNLAHEAMLYLCILAYFALWEVLNNGQTPGKSITGTRLVRNCRANLTFYDATLRASILFLTPRIAATMTSLVCFLIDYTGMYLSPNGTYLGSLIAIPMVLLITKGKFAIHDLFSETEIVLATESDHREHSWPSKETRLRTLGLFVLLTLCMSWGVRAHFSNRLPALLTGNDKSTRDGGPPYHNVEFFSEFGSYMVSLDEITRSMHAGEEFIDCDRAINVQWIAGIPITFEHSPSKIRQETRQSRFDSRGFFIYRVPVTRRGFLSWEAQTLVAQFIRSKVGDDRPILIEFHLTRSCAFAEVRFTKHIAVDRFGNILEPDDASWCDVGFLI